MSSCMNLCCIVNISNTTKNAWNLSENILGVIIYGLKETSLAAGALRDFQDLFK